MNFMILLLTVTSLHITCISSQADIHLIMKLSKVQTTEEFLQNFVLKDGIPINISSIQPDEENGDRVVVSGGDEQLLAPYDLCTPRLRTVVIPRDQDPNVIYWPSCTRIERCGGCCPTEMLECLPKKTELVQVNVLKTRVPWPGATDLVYDGPFPVLIQKDIDCEPMCRIKPRHCNPLQDYDESTCSCNCKNTVQARSCSSVKIWSKDECSCVCLERKKCRGLFKFSRSSCKCELRDVVSSDMSVEELIEFIREHVGTDGKIISPVTETGESSEAPEVTTLITDATSTELTSNENTVETPTIATEQNTEATTVSSTEPSEARNDNGRVDKPVDPCLNSRPCPPGWTSIILRNGLCGCKPGFAIKIPRRHVSRQTRSVFGRYIPN